MRGTCASLVGLTLLLGCDSSRKKPPPEPAKTVEASAPARGAGAVRGAGAARDAGAASDAGVAPAPAPDPIAAGLERVYRPGETLPDPMRRRIRSRLQASSKVPIALHHIIEVPRPDGGREVFALTESSVYEQCLTEWRTPDERREHCLGQRASVVDHTLDWNGGPGPKYAYKDIRLNQHCVTLGAVHAVFGPAGPKDPADAGGALEVAALALPDLRCVVRSYHRVLVADLDGDKQLEMYVDLTAANEQTGEVRGDFTDTKTVKQYATAERVYILSGDVTAIQVALDLGEGTYQADESANGGDAPRAEEPIALIDADRDGHRDVLEIKPCFKEGVLPVGAPGPPPCDVEPHETVVHRYDPANDRYLDGVPGRNFADRLHGQAMKALAGKRAETAVQLWRDAAVIDPTWSWPPYNLACQAALAGRSSDAFAQLRLLALRSPDLDLVHRLDTDPDLASLRKVAAFDDVENDIVRAVLPKLSLSPTDDDPRGKLGFSNESAAFAYTCGDCTAATSGTFRYADGKLELAAGESRASYELRTRPEQLCFARADRAKAAGSGSDDTAPPLPDSCWQVR
jgi:hypothetical protein